MEAAACDRVADAPTAERSLSNNAQPLLSTGEDFRLLLPRPVVKLRLQRHRGRYLPFSTPAQRSRLRKLPLLLCTAHSCKLFRPETSQTAVWKLLLSNSCKHWSVFQAFKPAQHLPDLALLCCYLAC